MQRDDQQPQPGDGGFKPFGLAAADDEQVVAAISREAKSTRPSSFAWRAARVAAVVAVIASIGITWASFQWLGELGVFEISKDQLDLIAQVKPLDNSEVFDRDGRKVGEYFNSYQVYIPFAKLPKDLVNAIVAIEDRSFWTHKGFDPRGIVRAAVSKLKGSSTEQGASTLTQQIVRHFLLPNERTLARKVKEVALAIQLEHHISKERIIEIYANSLFLGNGSYGVGAAARRYFGKEAAALSTEEAALIAGLFQSPSRFNPAHAPERAKARQLQVLKAMYKAKMLTFAKAKELAKIPLVYKTYQPMNEHLAPYWVDFIKQEAEKLLKDQGLKVSNQGLRIYTTLDQSLQQLAEKAVDDAAPALDAAAERTQQVKDKDGMRSNATVEASVLSIDPRNGEILAMVGGRDYAQSKFNRTYQALRSPGSAFKPVVYSLALQSKWKWSDMIFVSPITINNYRPHTPDEDMLTETTLMRAFYRSMNTPTVELGQKLGLKNIIAQAERLGLRSPIKEEFGITLGSSDATLMDLARMYGTFANNGNQVELVAIKKITDRDGAVVYQAPLPSARSKQALSPQVAYLMTQGMRAVLSMGTGYTSAHLSGVAAGKTGTSNDSTDNWFCGYAPNLATVVWVGTDEHVPMRGDVTGGKLALPIWDKFMTKAFEKRPATPFLAPPGIVWTTVNPKFGNRSQDGVKMFFLKGNEPPAESSALEALSQSTEGGYRDVFAH